MDEEEIIMSYTEEVYERVVAQNPNEPEFHQAVKEVLDSLKVVIDKNEEKYRKLSILERLVEPEVIAEERRIYKGVSANVDFYSGFVYSMLDLPLELYTPMFAVARIVGWSAHRMEELINADKIIRPAYKNVLEPAVYVPLNER